MYQHVFNAFGLKGENTHIERFGPGLINHTWKLVSNGNAYILQRINQQVFKHPADIAFNTSLAGQFLAGRFPSYLFVQPLTTIDGKFIYQDEEAGWFRLLPFIENSHSEDVVLSPETAFEAASQFGKFTRLLKDFDAGRLKITLPDFHNLSLRWNQFENALTKGNHERIIKAAGLIREMLNYKYIVDIFEKIKTDPGFKTRVTHHDTKISNVLLDPNGKGLCVIDLDTMMPGFFISDFGDMMRTYLSPVSEEEADFSKIAIRTAYFKAIVDGYLGQLKDELSETEKKHMVYAGKFMICMQAMRFLTDYLNNDAYYGAKYEAHNFVRAGNQLTLLERVSEKEDELQGMVEETVSEN